MNPIDPVPSSKPVYSPMAAPYDDENPNEELVEQGLNVAEDERREAVADAYDNGRRQDPDNIDEIDISDFGSDDPSPSELEVLSGAEMVVPDLPELGDEEE